MGRIVRCLFASALACRLLLGGAAEGLAYRSQQAGTDSGQPLSIHILEIDPQKVSIRLVRALNDGLGRETVSSMARRSGAHAAVNGGFFRMGGRHDGLPSGILKIGPHWYAGSGKPRAALGWRQDGSGALMGRLLVHWELEAEGAAFPVTALNQPRGRSSAVLYTWAFHRTTLTDPGGFEVLIRDGHVTGTGSGDSPIPVEGFVYSVGASRAPPQGLQAGQKVALRQRFEPQGEDESKGRRQDWEQADFIVNGAGLLIAAGRLVTDWAAEQLAQGFIDKPHPRTALGWRPEGIWLAVVVDGRQPSVSAGMTLAELARYMQSLGCSEALNLDGGGSSTIYFEGKVRNTPSDFGKERAVSDAIVFIEKER